MGREALVLDSDPVGLFLVSAMDAVLAPTASRQDPKLRTSPHSSRSTNAWLRSTHAPHSR